MIIYRCFNNFQQAFDLYGLEVMMEIFGTKDINTRHYILPGMESVWSMSIWSTFPEIFSYIDHPWPSSCHPSVSTMKVPSMENNSDRLWRVVIWHLPILVHLCLSTVILSILIEQRCFPKNLSLPESFKLRFKII